MKCKHCHKEIILVPSAAERAAKDVTGKTAAHYTSLFDYHSECTLELRSQSVAEVMQQNKPTKQERQGFNDWKNIT